MSVVYPGLTPQQVSTINNAVTNAFSGWNQKTAGEIDQYINNALASSGLFSAAQLAAISQGEQAAEPHGPGFVESDIKRRNFANFVASWESNIARSLGQLQNAPGGGSSGGGSTGTTPPVDPILQGLTGALTSAPQQPQLPVPELYSYPTSGGVNPVGLVLLAGAVGLAWYWWKHKHHDE